jgi:hypothetical protein
MTYNELDALVAQVPSAENPYEVGLAIMSAAVEPMLTPDIASRQYVVWGGLTDWFELKPDERAEALRDMRRAATEWDAVRADPTARDRYFDRWRYDVLGLERPA